MNHLSPNSMARLLLSTLAVFILSMPVVAGKTTAIREAVKHVIKRGGSESVEQLTRRAATLASRYGDDGLKAFKKVGAHSLQLADDAGPYGLDAIRILSRHGNAANGVVRSRSQLALYSRYGDDAALALVKHGQIAGPIIGQFGKEGANATVKLSGQNARRLAMMTKDKIINRKLVHAIGQYGDSAMNFIYRNKLALATSAGLAAFLSNPEVFLDGGVELADALAGHTVAPIAATVNWTLVTMICLVIATTWLWRRTRHRSKLALVSPS